MGHLAALYPLSPRPAAGIGDRAPRSAPLSGERPGDAFVGGARRRQEELAEDRLEQCAS